MATSPENFAKVKNILRKLDQGIDQARNRRMTQTARPAMSPVHATPASMPAPPAVPAPLPAPSGSAAPLRARPLNRPVDGFGFAS